MLPATMSLVTEPECVLMPDASKAFRVNVRSEPAGTVTVPVATPLTIGMLNANGVEMSGAVTTTTTVATGTVETSALTNRVAMSPSSPGGGAITASGEHAPKSSTAALTNVIGMQVRRSIVRSLRLKGSAGFLNDDDEAARDTTGRDKRSRNFQAAPRRSVSAEQPCASRVPLSLQRVAEYRLRPSGQNVARAYFDAHRCAHATTLCRATER